MKRIDLEPVRLGQYGQRYRVHYEGAVLIKSSRNPEFDACRELLALGITGRVEVWHKGASGPMRIDIAKGARLTVEDGDLEGLRFVRWRKRADDIAANSVSRRAGSSRIGTNKYPQGSPPKENRPKKTAI